MKSKIVQLFEQVQKISYNIGKFDKDLVNPDIPYGDCRHKSELLYSLLSKEGYKVKKLKVEFNWKDLPIPKNILDILKISATIFPHNLLLVKINNKWIKVDCTWNPELENKGFPITKNWDGETDTKQITKGKLKFYKEEAYIKKRKTIKEEAFKFAEGLNKYLSS
ncbi:hypothetical protein J4221_06510 [Candidatus Pacearchaeota archaeon]|nr:hypothetical protein [Candidatus Pacearchaeota archaeon]